MPEVNQYTLNHNEIVELILKDADIHEGLWTILIGFNIGAGNFALSDSEVAPGVMATLAKIGIQRADANTSPSLIVDASKVNPSKTHASKPTKGAGRKK